MMNTFNVGARRGILDANFNYHREGELHPDRILDFHDLIYIVDGGWEIGQDGRAYVLEKGDLIILHAGHHHYGLPGRLPGVKTMYLHMNRFPEEALSQTAEYGVSPEITLALPVVIRCGNSMAVKSIFTDIISTFWSGQPHKTVKLAALADLLLCELHALSDNSLAPKDKLVDETLNLIRVTPDRILSLDELAAMLNVCSRSLTGRFKRVTGKTLHQYQLELKLEMARMHMKGDPGRPFKDLAANLGFYDEFHFSKLFKKKYGVSPAQYRMQIGGK